MEKEKRETEVEGKGNFGIKPLNIQSKILIPEASTSQTVFPIRKKSTAPHYRQMWIALSGHRGCGFHPILSRLPNPAKGRSPIGVEPAHWPWRPALGRLARGRGAAVLTSLLCPALVPVLPDHGAQVPEGELLRLQHAALLHAHRRWLRCLLCQRLRLAGPVPHGPNSGGVPTHLEAQGGTAGPLLPSASRETHHPYGSLSLLLSSTTGTPAPTEIKPLMISLPLASPCTQPIPPNWLLLSTCCHSVAATVFPTLVNATWRLSSAKFFQIYPVHAIKIHPVIFI